VCLQFCQLGGLLTRPATVLHVVGRSNTRANEENRWTLATVRWLHEQGVRWRLRYDRQPFPVIGRYRFCTAPTRSRALTTATQSMAGCPSDRDIGGDVPSGIALCLIDNMYVHLLG
jgi:hypothetical protein